jgi:hypothetical protein
VGERHQRDEVGVRPADDARAGRNRRFDDRGAGSSHAPQGDVGRDLEDFHH